MAVFSPSEFPTRCDSFMEQYKLGKEDLSESALHSVFKARNLESNEKLIVHVYPKRQLRCDQDRTQILVEATALSYLDHPNGIRLYDFFQDSVNYYIITERAMGETLIERIKNSDSRTEATFADYMQQIFSLLSHLSSFSIVNRSVNPDNLLFASKCF